MNTPSIRGVDFTGLAILAGAAVLVYLGYELVKHVSLFNPASQNNLANTGFNSLYQNVTGSQGTLGGDIYSWLHPDSNVNASPSVPVCYQRDANGALVYNNGTIQQVPCSQNPPGYQNP